MCSVMCCPWVGCACGAAHVCGRRMYGMVCEPFSCAEQPVAAGMLCVCCGRGCWLCSGVSMLPSPWTSSSLETKI